MLALQAEMKTHQERMEAMTETNNEKFEVLQENMWTMRQGMGGQDGGLIR
jgi:DNA-binding ferritin-like protein (Dps family)